jgi:thymidine phosphorylase
VLANAHGAPQDLKEKSLLLAGRIIDFDPALRGGGGHAWAREILESGQALAAMERIIDGQGRNPARQVPGELTAEIPAPSSGWITAIDCFRIGRIARLAGAPMDKGAGIDLLAKLGDKVERGQPLYRIHACFQSDFRFACDLAADSSGYGIDDREPPRYGAGGAP